MSWLKQISQQSVQTAAELFRLMIPVMVVVKILEELGAVEALGRWLGPLMSLFHLPGETGIVLAASMIVNIYGGLVALFSLFSSGDLTVAQVTVLSGLCLVIHSLFIETRVSQGCGVRGVSILIVRVGGGLLYGYFMAKIFEMFQLFREPASFLWVPEMKTQTGWMGWVMEQLQTLGMIFLIIIGLIIMMDLLKRLGLIAYLEKTLTPVLSRLKLSSQATSALIIGLFLGLTYGAALILKEVRAGRLSSQDIFGVNATLCLTHAIIEDTLLMMITGANWFWISVIRFIFTAICVFFLMRFYGEKTEFLFMKKVTQ